MEMSGRLFFGRLRRVEQIKPFSSEELSYRAEPVEISDPRNHWLLCVIIGKFLIHLKITFLYLSAWVDGISLMNERI